MQPLQDWNVTPARAIEIQRQLAGGVSPSDHVGVPRLIAGADISVRRGSKDGTGAVVVVRYPDLQIIEVQLARQPIEFPYVPGLLSFREAPLVVAAWQQLSCSPDLLLVDGQGIAHPRRFGLASHVGRLLDVPTIGCAKSRLCGQHSPLDPHAGNHAELRDGDQLIGAAVCTKDRCKPLYVSIGHKVDLAAAIRWTLQTCLGKRVPEPLRFAHLAAGGNLAPPN